MFDQTEPDLPWRGTPPDRRCRSSPTAHPRPGRRPQHRHPGRHRRAGRVLRRRRRVAARASWPRQVARARRPAPAARRRPAASRSATSDRDATTRLPDRDRVTLADLLRDRLTELHPSTFLVRRAALLDGIGLVDEADPGQLRRGLRVAAAGRPGTHRCWPCPSRWSRCTGTSRRSSPTAGGRSSPPSATCSTKHPEFQREPAGAGPHQRPDRLRPRRPRASRRPARSWARRTLSLNRRERRGLPGPGHQPRPGQRQDGHPAGPRGRQGHLAPTRRTR